MYGWILCSNTVVVIIMYIYHIKDGQRSSQMYQNSSSSSIIIQSPTIYVYTTLAIESLLQKNLLKNLGYETRNRY